MSEFKWELIFINNDEFKTYLNSFDYMELCMLSKLVRLKLKSKLFDSITISKCYKDLIIEEISQVNIITDDSISSSSDLKAYAHIKLFNRSIQNLMPYISSVNIKSFSSNYHLLEISNLIPQLTNLSIYHTKLSLTTLKNTLTNLESLKSLQIQGITLIQYRGETYPIEPIKLCSNLKFIHWTNCTVSLCDLEEDPKSVNYNYGRTLSERIKYLFQYNNFPDLQKFSCHLLPTPFIKKVLLLNPQLSWLDIKIRVFSDVELSLFHSIKNIKKLELSVDYLSVNLSNIGLNFPSLTSLYFYKVNFGIWPIIEKISLSSPNIIELKVDLESDTTPPIFNLVNNLNSLRKLIVKSKNPINLNFNTFKSCSSLKYLDTQFKEDIYRLLLKLGQFPNLKVVCFKKEAYNNNYISSLNNNHVPKPWKLVNIGEVIKGYK